MRTVENRKKMVNKLKSTIFCITRRFSSALHVSTTASGAFCMTARPTERPSTAKWRGEIGSGALVQRVWAVGVFSYEAEVL